MKRVELIIRGRVQGVFYRANTKDVASQLGLTGFVKNMPGGGVKVVAEGDEDNLRQLASWCHKGPPSAHVDEVDENWSESTGEFTSFKITF